MAHSICTRSDFGFQMEFDWNCCWLTWKLLNEEEKNWMNVSQQTNRTRGNNTVRSPLSLTHSYMYYFPALFIYLFISFWIIESIRFTSSMRYIVVGLSNQLNSLKIRQKEKHSKLLTYFSLVYLLFTFCAPNENTRKKIEGKNPTSISFKCSVSIIKAYATKFLYIFLSISSSSLRW